MNLAENLTRDFPQVVGEAFSNESKERWAIALACQKERGPGPSRGVEIGVRVLG